MRKEILVMVVTSEKTWVHLQEYCFNINFQTNRHFFDLAVVLNGNNDEALSYIKQSNPDYLYVRPNLGLDPAGFDYLESVYKL